MQVKEKTKIKKKYFHGIGTLIADTLDLSEKYVRDVLNGLHDDRDTEAVRKIKEEAEKYTKKAS